MMILCCKNDKHLTDLARGMQTYKQKCISERAQTDLLTHFLVIAKSLK